MLEKIEGRRRRGQQRVRWLNGITDSMGMTEQTPGYREGQGSLLRCGPCCHRDQTRLGDWTMATKYEVSSSGAVG